MIWCFRSIMAAQRAIAVIAALLMVTVLLPASGAHEQKTLTVIMTGDGVVSGNITDSAFVQGNALWFRMEDSSDNASMVVRFDSNMDGSFNASDDNMSTELVNECALDENGSLVDEDCAVSWTYAFDMNAEVGTYLFWIDRTQNGTETTWNHSIIVHEDIHEEDGPSPGDCFGAGCPEEETVNDESASSVLSDVDRTYVLVLGAVSLIGMAAMLNSIRKEKRR